MIFFEFSAQMPFNTPARLIRSGGNFTDSHEPAWPADRLEFIAQIDPAYGIVFLFAMHSMADVPIMEMNHHTFFTVGVPTAGPPQLVLSVALKRWLHQRLSLIEPFSLALFCIMLYKIPIIYTCFIKSGS